MASPCALVLRAHLSLWAGGLVWLQLSREQRLELPSLLAGECFSPALDGLCPLGRQQWGRGAERAPSRAGGWPFACWTPSWPPVPGKEDAEQGGDLTWCPAPGQWAAPAALLPGDMAPSFRGWSRLLVPLCLLALAWSPFSQFNLLLSAQYVTVEQLSGILGSLRAPAASPLGCAPPAPSSSGCAAPPPPLPSLSSPSNSAEVRVLVPSLCPCALMGR